jgi:hypothetical protein
LRQQFSGLIAIGPHEDYCNCYAEILPRGGLDSAREKEKGKRRTKPPFPFFLPP